MGTMPKEMPDGMASLSISVSAPGRYSFRAEGDRMGKLQLLAVLQLVQKDLVDEVAAGVRSRTNSQGPQTTKTAYNSPKVDVQQAESYNDEVPLPKDLAIKRYMDALHTLRSRILAINAAPSDEMFIVREDILQEL